MKATYGGAELDLGTTVAIFDTEEAVPIFHASREGGTEREGCSWSIRRARCGLAIFEQELDEPYRLNAIEIPTRHAVHFGRPCRRCWPELLRRPTLFERPSRGSGRDGSQSTLEDVEAVFADAGLTEQERL